MNTEVLQKAANESRGLAMDAIAACKSGHLAHVFNYNKHGYSIG